VRRAVIIIVACALLAACSSSSSTKLVDLDKVPCSPPPTTHQPSSLPALQDLAAQEQAPIVGRVVTTGHGAGGPQPTFRADLSLNVQLSAARLAACSLRTSDDAQRAGYVLSSAYTEGVGTHWTNWSRVDAPFDPATPSMLLYAPRHGVDELVGFSYWVRSRTEPVGFDGEADHWHRHYGLCFDTRGVVQTEGVATAKQCDGTWLNGGDLWMLHAWVAPGYPNAWGTFAPMNPSLCRKNVPDVLRCPES
jgi:hypothetical protein